MIHRKEGRTLRSNAYADNASAVGGAGNNTNDSICVHVHVELDLRKLPRWQWRCTSCAGV